MTTNPFVAPAETDDRPYRPPPAVARSGQMPPPAAAAPALPSPFSPNAVRGGLLDGDAGEPRQVEPAELPAPAELPEPAPTGAADPTGAGATGAVPLPALPDLTGDDEFVPDTDRRGQGFGEDDADRHPEGSTGAEPLPKPDSSWLEALDREPGLETDVPGAEAGEPPATTADPAALAPEPAAAPAPPAEDALADLPPWMAWIDDAPADAEPAPPQPAVPAEAEAEAEIGGRTGAEPRAEQAAEPQAWVELGRGESDDELPILDIDALLLEPDRPAEDLSAQADASGAVAAEGAAAGTPPWTAPDSSETGERVAPGAPEDDAPEPPEPDQRPAAEPAVAAVEAVEAAFGGVVGPGAALPEAFSGVFHEVADRLDNIADSLRRQSRGEATEGRNNDPLELLLTGFVLGYIAREGKDPGRRSG